MKKITLKHEINCSVERFWKVFFDDSFNTSLFKDELKFPEYSILDVKKDGDQVTRRVIRGRPTMNMPKPVMKLLGDSFGYEEEGTWDAGKSAWHFKMKPNTLADKLNNFGTVTCEKISDDKCRRIAEISMEAKVFGLGGVIESSTEKEMRDGWDKSAVYMNKWLAQHPE